MLNLTNRSLIGSKQRIFFVFAALLLVSATACDGGCGGSGTSSKTVPKTATARVTNMASHLPASTQVSFVVGDLEGMRNSLQTTRDTIGNAVPMTGLVEQQAKGELGIDIFDAESWKKSGIAADSGMTFSIVGTRPVMLTYIDDVQKFEKHFGDKVKEKLGVEGMPKSVTARETQVKVLGTEDESIAWAYNGKLVAVAFPEASDIQDYASSENVESAADLAAMVATQDAKTSLGADKGFKRFQEALANDNAISIYINPDTVFNEKNIDSLTGGDDNAKAPVNWAKENVEAFGIGFNAKDNAMVVRGWAALPETAVAKAKAILSAPADFPIKNFATDNTLIALRQSFNMTELWKFYTEEVLDEAERAELDEQFGKVNPDSDFHMQKDLIGNLSGNYSVLVYGVDPNAVQAAGGNVVQATMNSPFKTLAVLAPVQFKDKAGLEKVVAYMLNQAGEQATRKTVKDGVDVIVDEKMGNNAPGRFFVKDNLLVFATAPISDNSVADYINGNRDDKALGANEALNLGGALVTTDNYNGLYLNFLRAQDHILPALGPMEAMVEPFLIKLEEASVTTELGKDGGFIQLAIDLNPNAPKPETADAPSK